MSMSGITISEEVGELYKGVKMESGNKRFMILKLSDDKKQIEVDHCPDKDGSSSEDEQALLLKDFVAYLRNHVETHQHKCGFGILKAGKKTGGKVTFVSLIPDDATVKMKMLYASVIEPIRQSLEGIQVAKKLNEINDLNVALLEDV